MQICTLCELYTPPGKPLRCPHPIDPTRQPGRGAGCSWPLARPADLPRCIRLGTALGLIPGFASAARPTLAPARGRRTVLILGAGISGLVAAYELGRAGYQCTVLEASHRAGGRNLTLRHGDKVDELGNPQTCPFDDDPDLYLNAGPARIPSTHERLLDYCREFDVALTPFVNDNHNAWVQDDAMFGGKPVRNREYVTDARGFMSELLAKGLAAHKIDAPLDAADTDRLIAVPARLRRPRREPHLPRLVARRLSERRHGGAAATQRRARFQRTAEVEFLAIRTCTSPRASIRRR